MDRHELANQLRDRVLPVEKAERKARDSTTSEIIHRLSTEQLSPPLSDIELRAYMDEGARRLINAAGKEHVR